MGRVSGALGCLTALVTLSIPSVAAAGTTPMTMAQASGSSGCVGQLNPAQEDSEQPKCDEGKSLLSATSLAITADGKSLYVGSYGSPFEGSGGGRGGIAEFARASDGGLTQKGCITNDSGSGLTDSHGACRQGAGLASVEGLALTADDASLYAVSRDRSSITAFTRDAATSLLDQFACLAVYTQGRCGSAYAILRAAAVAASPDGNSVYVASSGIFRQDLATDAIASFARDPSTGQLTEGPCISETGSDGLCATGKGIGGVDGIVVSPDSKDVYTVSGNAVASFRNDPSTGALAQTGCITESPKTSCSHVKPTGQPTSIAVSADGKNVYAASVTSPALMTYSRDATTGKLTFEACNETPPAPDENNAEEAQSDSTCAPLKALENGSSVAVSPDGKSVLVTGQSPGFGATLTTLTRNQSTGKLTAAGCLSADEDEQKAGCGAADDLSSPVEVKIAPDGSTAYVADSDANAVFIFDVAATVSRRVAAVDAAGRVRVPVSCPASRAAGCRGWVRLARTELRKKPRRAVQRPLTAVRRFSLQAGKTKSMLLRLNRRPGKGTVVAVLADRSGKTRPVTRRITLRR
jgi:DNA-binding beta-propeller fold protein YncE